MGEPWDYPPAQGLYDPSRETAACGVGFIVNIDGEPSAKVRCFIGSLTGSVCLGGCEVCGSFKLYGSVLFLSA